MSAALLEAHYIVREADEIDHLRRRHHELLESKLRRLDAERNVIAAKLSILEETHDLVLGVVGEAVDSSCAARACSRGSMQAQVTGKVA
jgi:hypothetical protein